MLAAVLLTAGSVAILTGCNGKSGPVDPFGDDNKYRFGGVIIKDYNLNTSSVVASLERNDTLVTGATIEFGANSLAPSGNLYIYIVSPAENLPSDVFAISVQDSSRFADSLAFVIPGRVSIASIAPTVKAPSDLVTITWTGAAGAAGYIIAAVKRDSSYLGLGYSRWVTSQTTSIGISDSAFMKPAGGETNPGMYDLYVYAYSGAPDSALLSNLLPTPIPSQLDDNVNEESLAGTISGVVASASGTLEVVAE